MMIVSRWTDMGPEWKTEDIFRIRELFRENHISFRMPFSDLFFTSVFHMPEKDKRWGIRVREKDRSKAAALLIREGLADKNLLRAFFISRNAKRDLLHTYLQIYIFVTPL